jgi:NAD(P)-dependent dehydrogenase (short-subunit alcohol dehydrogenase family)
MTTALITGANRGLGLQATTELAAKGWTMWMGSRDVARGQQAAAALRDAGYDVRVVRLDVTDDDSVAAAVDVVGADGAALDVLVNNAGIGGTRAAVEFTTPADFLPAFSVNLLGPVRVTQAFLPLLRRASDPRVVMVSSGMGSMAITSDPERIESSIHSLVYPSSKAALNMVSSQYERAIDDVTFRVVDPGYTATDLNGHSGHQTVEEGARVIVDVASAPAGEPAALYVDAAGPLPW